MDQAVGQAVVQALLDTAPPSWRAAFRSHGLPDHPDAADVVDVMLERTAGGNDAGPRGKARHVPPRAVREAALKGLLLSHRFNYAGWDGIGLARAVQLATAPAIWDRFVHRMAAFFERNKRYMRYATFGDDRAGASSWLAWLNWGGTPGWEWAAGQIEQE